jgi:hypothetical protein
VSVRFTLQSLRKSISIWRSYHSNHTTISGHNNATFRKSYILPFLTFFFRFFSELYSFSFLCFWVLMYMYNMLLRFEKKIFCHIRTRYAYRKYIFLYENKSCSFFFKHFLWFKLYKSDQFQFIISDFFSWH